MASVLIVDDHEDTCRILQRLIQRMGHAAFCCTGGRQAMECLGDWLRSPDRAPPNLVLLDMRMPELSGLEVLRAIRADPRMAGLAVVVYSAGGEPEDRRLALDAGAADYWVKTDIDYARLGERLSPYLG